MGFFDRFKKGEGGSAPDALTREATARVRAVPGVQAVEAVDADTLAVTWNGVAEPVDLSLAGIRQRWSEASGFDRIEVMDAFIEGVSPPAAAAPSGTEAAAPSGTEEDGAETWETVRGRIRPLVGRPGASDADSVRWAVAGVLEATAVLDDPVALPVTRSQLDAWGVGDDAVRAAAETNQAAIDPILDPIGAGEPAWVPTEPSGHLAGWLCAPDRLLSAAGLEEAVVLVPLPTELVLVDPSATDLVESILTSTRTIVEQEARVLWPAPFLARPGTVDPWAPPADHPCADLVEQMRQLGD